MLIPSRKTNVPFHGTSLSRRVNANSQLEGGDERAKDKLIKKGEC